MIPSVIVHRIRHRIRYGLAIDVIKCKLDTCGRVINIQGNKIHINSIMHMCVCIVAVASNMQVMLERVAVKLLASAKVRNLRNSGAGHINGATTFL